MPSKKPPPSPKKPPARKRRANTLLAIDNKRPSSSQDVAAMNVPATPAPKAPSLKLVMASRKPAAAPATPSLRLNGPKPPRKQRPEPITESLLDLVAPSSPVLSQLPEFLDSMPPPDFPSSKRLTFSQMLANESLALIGRSESPYSSRSSYHGFSAPSMRATSSNTQLTRFDMRATPPTPPNTQLTRFDSQATTDNEEDREERSRQEALKSQQQKKGKEPAKPKTKSKLSNPPMVQKNAIEVDSLSEQEEEVILYKLNVESFWEGEKIAFNTEIEKRQLGGAVEKPSLYILSATQDNKAREHATSLGHVSCHRVSLVATPSHGSLAAAKQKHFSVAKTGPGEYRQVLDTILEELLDWKLKKELQIGLIYRYARNKSGVIEKEPAAVKTVPAMITHSGRSLGSRSVSLAEIPTSSNPTGRLLNAQTVEDENNPAIAVRRELRNRWKCLRRDCDSQDYPEPACYVNHSKDPRKHYLITAQDLNTWSAAILEDRSGRLTIDQPPASMIMAMDRTLRNKQKNEARNSKKEEDNRVSASTVTPSTTIIQLPTQSTSATGALSEYRSSRLEAELAARGHYDPQRSVSRVYSRGVTVTPVTPAPEQRALASSPVHVDLKDFIEDMKLGATSHEQRGLEDAKQKLLDKHYKSHHIQPWKGDAFEHQWEKLGIQPGIGRDLADNIGKFGRRKTSGRVLTHAPASTVSTAKPIMKSIEDEGYGQRQHAEREFEDEFEGESDLDETLYEDNDNDV